MSFKKTALFLLYQKMNGIEFLETPGFGMQGEPIGMEEIDGIYKLGGRYEPGPTPKDGVVDGKSLTIK